MASSVSIVWTIPRTSTAVDTARPPYAVAYRRSSADVPKNTAANAINSNPAVSWREEARSVFSNGRRSCSVIMATFVDVLVLYFFADEMHVPKRDVGIETFLNNKLVLYIVAATETKLSECLRSFRIKIIYHYQGHSKTLRLLIPYDTELNTTSIPKRLSHS